MSRGRSGKEVGYFDRMTQYNMRNQTINPEAACVQGKAGLFEPSGKHAVSPLPNVPVIARVALQDNKELSK